VAILLKHLIPNLITESVQSIVNVGFPKIIANLLFKKFGNKAFTVAQWYRSYHGYGDKKDWFEWSNRSFSRSNLSLMDCIDLYNATDTPEHYLEMLKKLDLSNDDFLGTEFELKEIRESWAEEIEEKFFKNVFFTAYTLMTDIMSGKLTDIKPYENMKFQDASLKYDEKRVFGEMTPLKIYPNGYKWINVGKRCGLLGYYMKNCGSAGLMSTDSDRTLIGLFDSNHKPHIVVTYSPNEKRISGDEGVAGVEAKAEYHDYILDLSNILGAKFDIGRTKSKLLKLKSVLQNKATDLKKIEVSRTPSIYDDEFFRFVMEGKLYYSNGYYIVSGEDIQKVSQAVKTKTLNLRNNQGNKIKEVFNSYNRDSLKQFGVSFIPVENMSLSER